MSCHVEGIGTNELRISGTSSEEVYSTERRTIGKQSQRTILMKHVAPLKKSGKRGPIAGYYPDV